MLRERTRPLPQGQHELAPLPGIAECGTMTRGGGGPGAAFALQPCLSSRIPVIPDVCSPCIPAQASTPAASDTHSPLSWPQTHDSVGREHSALAPEGYPHLAAVWIQLFMEQPCDAPALPSLTVTISLYLQVPCETRGEMPPEPSQQQKFSCQPRAEVTFLLLHEAP